MNSLSKKEIALNEYFDECQEMLEHLSKNIDLTEKNGFDNEIIASIYRDMHTIKGTSQLFGFAKIGSLAHIMETCLDPVRKGKVPVSVELLDALFLGIDFIALSLQKIRENKKEPENDEELIKILTKFISIIEFSRTGLNILIKDKLIPSEDKIERSTVIQNKEETKTVVEESKKGPVSEAFEVFEKPSKSISSPTAPPIAQKPTQVKVEEVAANQDTAKKHASEEQVTETIRVQVTLLNSLMNLVGELVLIRNQLLQHAKQNDEDTEFLKISQRLNVLTAELQNEVMKTRMQPIGNILTIFSRVVRDLSRELGKKVDLVMHGVETELDKTIIEAVKDPLMHIVRNAVDHGIESLEERRKSGKKETAEIQLNAYNESGQVIIEIKDDGRGLDRQKIGNKAVEKGLISKETLEKMTDKEVQMLIFAPGFSTAETISNISGRGVGMDVVKTNVERIGGFVDVISEPGLGATILIKIPLSLAIVPALIVQSNGQRFAIPQSKLVELLRIEGSEDSTSEKIESLQGQSVLRLRGKLLPVIPLSQVLFIEKNTDTERPDNNVVHKETVSNVVILNADNFLFGIIVDEINDSADIVVKSLSSFLKELKVFSGATIMGDGNVALTIDVLGIAEKAKISIGSSGERPPAIVKTNNQRHYQSEICEYLLINVGVQSHYAIPLSIVNRLEEFENSRFEYSGEQKVIRYRETLLPVLSLPNFLKFTLQNEKNLEKERTPIVVIKRGDFLYGIEVVEIHDIVEVASQIDQSVKDRAGILGTISTSEKIIVIVDIFEMIDALKTHLSLNNNSVSTSTEVSITTQRNKYRILLVEDSSFFRNYVCTVLKDAGFSVESACDGENALEVLAHFPNNYFSLILSDIEMPLMNGYELARKVRGLKHYSDVPMIAITTKFSQKDVEEGLSAGFTKYLEKLNAEKLLLELDTILSAKNQNKELKNE